MGRELYHTQPAFRAALEQCDELLRDDLERPLLQLLYAADAEHISIDQTAHAQPALFAVEYALVQLWQSWGVKPDSVMGHSVGEYVAACVAGVFSLADGLRLVAHRARLMQVLPQEGLMIAVTGEENCIAELIQPYCADVSIAAVNGPAQVVVSGRRELVGALVGVFHEAGMSTSELRVSHAFHSPLMAPMLNEFRRVAETVRYQPPRLPLISNISGRRGHDEFASADYWCRHIRQPVRFAQGTAALVGSGHSVFLRSDHSRRC